MKKALIGEKLGMTQIFSEDIVVPVTVLRAGPCFVTQLKVKDRDGYDAVQLCYKEQNPERVNNPQKGHYEKAGVEPHKYLAEFPLDPGEYENGQKIAADVFEEGDQADVTGISKGKGFAGGVKRWGFAGGPASHGARFHRRPGAIGQCATPSRVFKGKKLPGRMGGERVTALNLKIVSVDKDKNLILVKGSVPGPKGSVVLIRESVKS